MAVQRRQLILAKVEATYGSDPTLAGGDALIAVDDLSLEVVTDPSDIEPIDGFLDGFAHIEGTQLYTLSFTTALKGSGTAGTAPEIGPLFKAVGFSETIVGATSVTYDLAEVFATAGDGFQSVSIEIEDGTLIIPIRGTYGTMTIDSSAPMFPKISWSFTGLYAIPTDGAGSGALSVTPTYQTTLPQPSRGLTMTLHGQAGGASFRPSSWTLDLNRETHVIRSIAETFGIAAIELGGCRPTGTFSMQELPIASKDWWTALEGAVLSTMSMAWAGSAGNIVTITDAGGTGGLAISGLSRTDNDGVIGLDATYSMGRSAGNDSLTIAFT